MTPSTQTLNRYDLDQAHSSAHFSVRHMMISKVHGGFSKISGVLHFAPENIQNSSIEASIEVASISTRDASRDEHLKGAEFFDAARFPLITFKSKRFEGAAGEYEITGDLSIHGVTREVKLAVEGLVTERKDPWGNLKVGDEVEITLAVQFARKA